MTDGFIFYRHSLPHIQPENGCFFITFRLTNTISQAILIEMLEERRKEERIIQQGFTGEAYQNEIYGLNKKYFGRYDAWLDRCDHGSAWLKDEHIAKVVMEQIQRLNNIRYNLLAYCIMPNHVHLLIDAANFSQISTSNLDGMTRMYPLTDTLGLLKGSTARYCNQILGRSGAFWHHESYDHNVRNSQELERIIRYILANPVKAGLVQDWKTWKFSYVALELGEW
jgi:Transposase and inactivated derivatives